MRKKTVENFRRGKFEFPASCLQESLITKSKSEIL
jgi:hypothetical protein